MINLWAVASGSYYFINPIPLVLTPIINNPIPLGLINYYVRNFFRLRTYFYLHMLYIIDSMNLRKLIQPRRHKQMNINFVSKSGEQLTPGQKIKVYVNLINGKMAIQNTKGIVVGYADMVPLKNVSFKVSQATRDRIVGRNRRTVCAYAVGEFAGFDSTEVLSSKGATFNPFKSGKFYYADGSGEIETSEKFGYCVAYDKLVYTA